MTIGNQIAVLSALVADDPRRADSPVTFGPAMEPVEGGIIGRRDGRDVLNLAPVRLDKVGGF